DHTALSQSTGIGKRIENSAYVSLIRSEKVGRFAGIELKKSILVPLRGTLQNGAPHPNDKMHRLLGTDRRGDELLIAHHPGVVAKPAAHSDTHLATVSIMPSATAIGSIFSA